MISIQAECFKSPDNLIGAITPNLNWSAIRISTCVCGLYGHKILTFSICHFGHFNVTHSAAANCHGWERSFIGVNWNHSQNNASASAFERCMCLFDTQSGIISVIINN